MMRKIAVTSLKAGVAFDQPVFISGKDMLAEAYQAIEMSDILRLQKFNVKIVETEGLEVITQHPPELRHRFTGEQAEGRAALESLVIAWQRREEFENLLDEGAHTLQDFYEKTVKELIFPYERLKILADSIVNYVEDVPKCFIFLYYSRGETTIYSHIMTASVFATVIAHSLKYSRSETLEIVNAILLMDIGMAALPIELRQSRRVLTEAEKKLMHSHALKGYQLLTQEVRVKKQLAEVALQHHEHFDGSGYPRGETGAGMSEMSRLAALVDSYAAILEPKSYRKPLLPYQAIKELLALGIRRYDPGFLRVFLNRFSLYPVGSFVRLSDNSLGLVIAPTEKAMRPVVATVRYAGGELTRQVRLIHLLFHTDLFVSRAIDPTEHGLDIYTEIERIVKQFQEQ